MIGGSWINEKACVFEKPAFSAWNLSSWSSVLSPDSTFLAPSRREILCFSRTFFHLIYALLQTIFLCIFSFLTVGALSLVKPLIFLLRDWGFIKRIKLLGLNLMFLLSFHLCFLLSYAFFVSPSKRYWFEEALRTPICINLPYSWIRYFVKESRDGIHQLGVVSIPE